MNFNALVAVLVLKGVLGREEAEKLVEYLNNKPQSTLLADTIEQIQEFITIVTPKLDKSVKDEVKKVAAKTAEKVAHDVDEAVNKSTDKPKKK